jgi:hypothetical protein
MLEETATEHYNKCLFLLAEYTDEQEVGRAGRQAEYVVTGEMVWLRKGPYF